MVVKWAIVVVIRFDSEYRKTRLLFLVYYEWALTEGTLRVALAAIRSIATCYM